MSKGENIFKRKDGRWEARYIKGYELSGTIKYGFCYGKRVTAPGSRLPPPFRILLRQVAAAAKNESKRGNLLCRRAASET